MRPTVAVVGGGLAGLTAAYRLRQAGAEVAVFEAQERVGGRMWSERFGDFWINFGAQYLAGDDTPAFLLAREIGVPLFAFTEPSVGALVSGRMVVGGGLPGFLLRLPMPLAAKISLMRVGMRLDRLRARLGPDAAGKRLMRELDERAFADLLAGAHPMVRALYRSAVVRMACGEPEDMSAYLGLSWVPGLVRPRVPGTPDFHQLSVIDGGTSVFAERLVQALEHAPQTGRRAERVREFGPGVEIDFADGSQWRGDGVVVAMPASEAARVIDGLPRQVRDRLDATVYGSFAVVGLAFDGPPPPPWDRLYAVQIVEPPFHVAANETWPHQARGQAVGKTVVKLLAGGRFGKAMMDMPDEEIVRQARAVLSQISPALGREPERVWVRKWRQALPYWSPGRMKAGRTPADFGRIQLAGDHADYPNTQGAVKSGQRAAEALQALLGVRAAAAQDAGGA
ncbi:MAG: NAD(P)/FAD-dependent oxidoreductase [Mesorhizobium sp.]